MKTWATILQAVERDGRCAMVTIAEVLGSAPREAGTRMIVKADGGFHGTIGGGTLEWIALAEAQKLLRQPSAGLRWSKHALGPELGQCCGGSVRLLSEVFDHDRLPELKLLAAAEETGPFVSCGSDNGVAVLRTVLEAADDKTPLIARNSTGKLLERFGEQKRALYLFGAGHVGKALMLSLAPLPFEVIWVDNRQDSFPAATPGNFTPHFTHDPVAELDKAPDGAFVLVMTHSHALDLELVHAALKAERFGYVGVIGSATKRARFTRRLKEAGLQEETVQSMICPIGIEGMTSKHPAIIAAAVSAELLIRDEELRTGMESIDNQSIPGQNKAHCRK